MLLKPFSKGIKLLKNLDFKKVKPPQQYPKSSTFQKDKRVLSLVNFDERIIQQISDINQRIYSFVQVQYNKADSFYEQQFQQCSETFIKFFLSAKIVQNHLQQKDESFIPKAQEIENDFFLFLQQLSLLKLFYEQNSNCLYKIGKKHKKVQNLFTQIVLKQNSDHEYDFQPVYLDFQPILQNSFMDLNQKKLLIFINLSEEIYLKSYHHDEQNNKYKYGKELLEQVKIQTRPISLKDQFFFGIKFCITCLLILTFSLIALQPKSYIQNKDNNNYIQRVLSKEQFFSVLPLMRGPLLVIFFYYSYIWALMTWKQNNVNYKQTLHLSKFGTKSATHIQNALTFHLLWAISLVIFIILNLYNEDLIFEDFIPESPFLILTIWLIIANLLPNYNLFSFKGKQSIHEAKQHLQKLIAKNEVLMLVTNCFSSFIPILNDFDYQLCYFFIYRDAEDEISNLYNEPSHNQQSYTLSSNLNSIIAGQKCSTTNRIVGLLILPIILVSIHALLVHRQMNTIQDRFHKILLNCQNILSILIIIIGYLYAVSDEHSYFFFILLISITILSTASLIIDIKYDWQLFNSLFKAKLVKNDPIYKFMFYYIKPTNDLILVVPIAILFFLRVCWAFILSPSILFKLTNGNEIIIMIFTTFEMFRRSIWCYFVVEKLHLENVQTCKAVQLAEFNDLNYRASVTRNSMISQQNQKNVLAQIPMNTIGNSNTQIPIDNNNIQSLIKIPVGQQQQPSMQRNTYSKEIEKEFNTELKQMKKSYSQFFQQADVKKQFGQKIIQFLDYEDPAESEAVQLLESRKELKYEVELSDLQQKLLDENDNERKTTEQKQKQKQQQKKNYFIQLKKPVQKSRLSNKRLLKKHQSTIIEVHNDNDDNGNDALSYEYESESDLSQQSNQEQCDMLYTVLSRLNQKDVDINEEIKILEEITFREKAVIQENVMNFATDNSLSQFIDSDIIPLLNELETKNRYQFWLNYYSSQNGTNKPQYTQKESEKIQNSKSNMFELEKEFQHTKVNMQANIIPDQSDTNKLRHDSSNMSESSIYQECNYNFELNEDQNIANLLQLPQKLDIK